MPRQQWSMVVSDELPKASSKERGGGGKVNFFFENLNLVPETSAPKEHFKLKKKIFNLPFENG